MKTLDEVIKKFELCNSYSYDMCNSSCPYFDDKCACDPDALHYLKEYQRYQNTPSRMVHMAMCDENNPLTWDELKQMKGKPVWVEESADNGLWWTYWVIWQDENAVLPEKTYGTTWQAYRKERG